MHNAREAHAGHKARSPLSSFPTVKAPLTRTISFGLHQAGEEHIWLRQVSAEAFRYFASRFATASFASSRKRIFMTLLPLDDGDMFAFRPFAAWYFDF